MNLIIRLGLSVAIFFSSIRPTSAVPYAYPNDEHSSRDLCSQALAPWSLPFHPMRRLVSTPLSIWTLLRMSDEGADDFSFRDRTVAKNVFWVSLIGAGLVVDLLVGGAASNPVSAHGVLFAISFPFSTLEAFDQWARENKGTTLDDTWPSQEEIARRFLKVSRLVINTLFARYGLIGPLRMVDRAVASARLNQQYWMDHSDDKLGVHLDMPAYIVTQARRIAGLIRPPEKIHERTSEGHIASVEAGRLARLAADENPELLRILSEQELSIRWNVSHGTVAKIRRERGVKTKADKQEGATTPVPQFHRTSTEKYLEILKHFLENQDLWAAMPDRALAKHHGVSESVIFLFRRAVSSKRLGQQLRENTPAPTPKTATDRIRWALQNAYPEDFGSVGDPFPEILKSWISGIPTTGVQFAGEIKAEAQIRSVFQLLFVEGQITKTSKDRLGIPFTRFRTYEKMIIRELAAQARLVMNPSLVKKPSSIEPHSPNESAMADPQDLMSFRRILRKALKKGFEWSFLSELLAMPKHELQELFQQSKPMMRQSDFSRYSARWADFMKTKRAAYLLGTAA